MRTISWKHSLVALFAVAAFAACSDDTTAPPPGDGGPDAANPCGNGKIDKGEDCDGTNLNSKNCMSASMGTKTGGSLSCSKTCKFDQSKCTGGGGAGGGGGMGGATGTGGSVGTGGGPGGRGGMKGDAGPDSGDGGGAGGSGGKTDGGGKTDSGSGGSAPTDAGKTD